MAAGDRPFRAGRCDGRPSGPPEDQAMGGRISGAARTDGRPVTWPSAGTRSNRSPGQRRLASTTAAARCRHWQVQSPPSPSQQSAIDPDAGATGSGAVSWQGGEVSDTCAAPPAAWSCGDAAARSASRPPTTRASDNNRCGRVRDRLTARSLHRRPPRLRRVLHGPESWARVASGCPGQHRQCVGWAMAGTCPGWGA